VPDAGWDDLDRTVGVRIYHGRTYTTGYLPPIGFLAFGGLFALVGVGFFFFLRRRDPRPAAG
jgi:hypothetical protein